MVARVQLSGPDSYGCVALREFASSRSYQSFLQIVEPEDLSSDLLLPARSAMSLSRKTPVLMASSQKILSATGNLGPATR